MQYLVNRAAHLQWLGLGVGLGFGLGLVLELVRLGLWLGLRNWPNAQRVWSNAQIDQMRRYSLCAQHRFVVSKHVTYLHSQNIFIKNNRLVSVPDLKHKMEGSAA